MYALDNPLHTHLLATMLFRYYYVLCTTCSQYIYVIFRRNTLKLKIFFSNMDVKRLSTRPSYNVGIFYMIQNLQQLHNVKLTKYFIQAFFV